MSNFNFTSLGYDFNVSVSDKIEDWLIIKDEKYRPDRGNFILENFNKDFPQIKVGDDVQKVYSLCGRSTVLIEWLAKKNLEYALIQGEPTFYRDEIKVDVYKKVSDELLANSSRSKLRSQEELSAAEEYKYKMDKISKKYSDYNFIMKESRVISMNSTELPLTLQLAIENYTPASDDSPNRRSFARELLINYKLKLIKIINEKPDVDIEALIKDAYVK